MKNSDRGTFPWKLFTRIFFIQLVIVVGLSGLAGFTVHSVYRRDFIRQTAETWWPALEEYRVDSKWCDEASKKLSSKGELKFTLIDLKTQHVICTKMVVSEGSQAGISSNIEMQNPFQGSDVMQAIDQGRGQKVIELAHGSWLVMSQLHDERYVVRLALHLENLEQSLANLDRALFGVFLLLSLALMGALVWLSLRWTSALGRALLRMTNLVNEEVTYANDPQLEDVDDEVGEWSELETSIHELEQNLREKNDWLLREREELEGVLCALQEAILAVDTEGHPLFFNAPYVATFGEIFTIFIERFRDPAMVHAFQECLSELTPKSVEIELTGQDSLQKRFAVAFTPLFASDDTVYGVAIVFHDITEVRKTEKVRIDFVANVSHELRTPLTSIQGYAETLAADFRRGEYEQVDRYLAVIEKNIQRLVTLINDLLDLSSLDSGVALHREEFLVESLTQRVIDRLQKKCDEKKISLQLIVSEAAREKMLFADSHRVEQVLTNLLDNAIKYTPPSGITKIQWDVVRLDDKGPTFTLIVKDSGPGIAPEHQARLFERFYRVDKARSRELGGTGLGLAIVKHSMLVHGGRAWVKSELGRGAEFICEFPYCENPETKAI